MRILWPLVLLGCGFAFGEPIAFRRVFAPQEGPVVPVEHPFRDALCLNGSWRFQPVANDLPQPQTDAWERTPIRIPSPWNVNAFPVESRDGGDFRCFPSYPKAWEKAQAGWLKRSFAVPAAWQGKRLILRFDAVGGDTQVFVNGRLVARHFDLFLPFEADVTDAVRFGESNELLVGVRKASLSDVPGRYGRRTYQGGSMWGQAIAGIWQDVFLEAVPAVRVADVFLQPDLATDTLGATVTLQNDSGLPRSVSVSGEVFPWLNRAGKGTLEAPEPNWALGKRTFATGLGEATTVPAHGTVTVRISTKVGGRLKPWAPGNPNLYSLVCRIDGDAKSTRFGWRQITFKGTHVLLNGAPLVMRGDSWHFTGIPQMTRRYAWAWFTALHDAGLNAVRLHAEPYPSFFLDMADEMGILVLDETAVWASDGGPKLDSDAYWSDTQRHLHDLIHRDRNHPAVFGWSVSNEVMAVVKNVFHAPKAVEDQAERMNGIWAAICRAEDPTRLWISADGEEDGGGSLPVSVIHYGDRGTMQRAIARDKPWGVGEAGPAYYGTPKQIAEMARDSRAYLSFADRMEDVARISYQSLKDQNELGGSYRSVFNLVWYGLQPLELGLRDTTRPPTLDDGISFPAFVEGRPGVQPERLGPYCSTLNPGYDPRLPLYRKWPLFDAIRAAAHGEPYPALPRLPSVEAVSQTGSVASVRLLSAGGPLAETLTDLGVSTSDASAFLIIDGANPPTSDAKATIEEVLAHGGTVFVWGARSESLSRLNALLPRPLTLAARTSSSLVAIPDPLTAGLTPAGLYFAELSPSTILPAGLDGPLMAGAMVLLRASDTDWRKWNGQGEMVKTALILRSEREAKPSGIALAEVSVGKGRLIVANLAVPETSQAVALHRAILGNLGIALGDGARGRNLLAPSGVLSGYLGLGPFEAPSREAAVAASPVRPNSGREIVAGATVDGRRWSSRLEFRDGNAVAFGYVSVWLYSPKDLTNLLLDPHLPTVGLATQGGEATQAWLDGKLVQVDGSLPLKAGWNHLLVKVIRTSAIPGVAGLRLTSSQPEYISSMRAVREAP